MAEFDPKPHFIDLPQGGKKFKYLPVTWRIQWLREEQQHTYGIESVLVEHDRTQGYALFKATLRDGTGRVVAEAHGWEVKGNFADYLGKAETVAVGRALAYAGYGTTAAAELDLTDANGEERAVDSGVAPTPPKVVVMTKPPETPTVDVLCTECQKPITGFQIKGPPLLNVSQQEVIERSKALVGHPLCKNCYSKHQAATAKAS